MITPTKYQPILFELPDAVNCNSSACGSGCDSVAGNWVQRMFPDDYVSFQFEVSPCKNVTNLIDNPDFAADGAGWTVESGSASFGATGAKLLSEGTEISFSPPLNLDQYYFVQVTGHVKSVEAPNPISVSLTNTVEDVTFFMGEQVQTWSFYVRSSTGAIGIIRNADTSTQPSTTYPVIQFVLVQPIELPDITIVDLDGNLIEALSGASFEPPYLNVYYTPSEEAIEEGVFQIKVNYACDEEEPVIYLSEPIKIIQPDDCFIQIGGCGNINVLKGSFTPFMRLESKLVADRSPNYERFLTRRTSGRYRMNYGRMSKTFTLSTAKVPEHVRDFIYLLPLCDKVVIKRGEGVQQEYFCDEVPDAPSFLESSDSLASITLPLVYKQDLIESIYVQECNATLPPAALGYRADNLIIKAADNTGINAG